MARSFNGSSQSMSSASAIDMSSSATVGISLWLWWNAFANDDKLALELGLNEYYDTNGLVIDPDDGAVPNQIAVGVGGTTGGSRYSEITRPSAGAWHLYCLNYDRAATTKHGMDSAYIDGSSVSLTDEHNWSTGTTNFASNTLYCMSRMNGSLWGAGRFAELALWPGRFLTASDVTTLWNGGNGNLATVISPGPTWYWRVLGDTSPEPENGGGIAMTLTGSPPKVAHPFTAQTTGPLPLFRPGLS